MLHTNCSAFLSISRVSRFNYKLEDMTLALHVNCTLGYGYFTTYKVNNNICVLYTVLQA